MIAARTAPRRPIRRLDPATIERIAAGEVVERPASVVKELVENAVDAGATAVQVRLEGGGIDRIEVGDGGIGIPPEELPLALERHATSKLADADGLATIGTLGFRGEALAAIATVAHLTITSRTADADAGATISSDGGTIGRVAPAGRAVGTTVDVRELFYNTPARRKFLRSPAAEQVEVATTVERLYLARPDVQLTLLLAGGSTTTYPRSPTVRDAAARVLGPELLDASFEVDAGLASGVRATGILGRPSVARATSGALFFSVNGRGIVSRPLAQAVRAAYVDLLPRTRFPVGALALHVPPARLDVNVHPTKREVRFADERVLADELRAAVRRALLGVPRVALGAERPAPFPGLSVPLRASPPPPLPSAGVQRTIDVAPGPREVAAGRHHPGLRLLGCVGALYWIAEAADGAVVVDQHAASERLLFDRIRARSALGRQELLEPIVLTLSGSQRAALEAHVETVRAAGYDLEAFGGASYRLAAVPEFLGRRADPEAVGPLLDELAAGGRPTVPDALVDRVAASIACHAAVRAGDVLDAAAMGRILERLYALPGPAYACPHGRPILVDVPRSRLDRWFLRAGA